MKKTLANRKATRSSDVVITTSRKRVSGSKELSSVEHTEHTPSGEVLPAHPAYVEVNAGLTKNIGNYESIRCGVSVSVPCRPTIKEIRRCHEKVSDLVSDLLNLEYDKAVEEDPNN